MHFKVVACFMYLYFRGAVKSRAYQGRLSIKQLTRCESFLISGELAEVWMSSISTLFLDESLSSSVLLVNVSPLSTKNPSNFKLMTLKFWHYIFYVWSHAMRDERDSSKWKRSDFHPCVSSTLHSLHLEGSWAKSSENLETTSSIFWGSQISSCRKEPDHSQ